MRKIINSTYITLDGKVEAPHEWPALPGGPAAESDGIQADLLRTCDTVLLGRRTYDGFAPVWPSYSGEVADRMNAAKKIVVSTTLTDPTWNNSTVINGDVAAQLRALKAQPGLDIVQYGFGAVTRLLLEHGLLDELRLWIYPLMVGDPAAADVLGHHTVPTFMDPVDTKVLSNGIVILRYTIRPS